MTKEIGILFKTFSFKAFSFKRVQHYSYLFSLLLLVLFISACEDNTPVKKRHGSSLPSVEITQVKRENLNHKIIVTGTLEPVRTVHFYNQVQGLLVELLYKEGDHVRQGNLLARLDNTIVKAEYDKAEATLKQSKLDYARLEKLATSNLTSKELLTRARTKVLLDQAEYNLQKKRLSYTRITAPWAGIISERKAEPGDVLPLHTHFLSLIDTSALVVKVAVSELYLSRIKQGDNIHFMIDALGKTMWSGKVLRIHPQINPETRKGIIEVSLTPVPNGAKPGQLTRIYLFTPKENVLVIPISAIRYDQRGAYVYRLKADQTIARRNILTGKKYPLLMEVLEGLQEGDTVITKGLFGLRSGKKVKPL